MKYLSTSFFILCIFGLFSNISAQSTITVTEKNATDSTHVPPEIKSVTKHSITVGGKIINYTATAGALILKNEKDESVALYGYTAYTKDGETDATKRPITFSYNGGPGSSSMWLHIGVMGPRRVVVNDPENAPQPPYKMEDNPFTLLDVSDIVMVDPVGTGLSHAVAKAKNKDFWGVEQDIKSVSWFIKQYINSNDRWNSPKFLLGESYGTMRSAGVVNYLQENLGISINGVVLVSSVLDLRSLSFLDGDDASYIMHLPTYAATAWFHNKIPNKPTLETFLKNARAFTIDEYSPALMKGDQLSESEKASVLNKLSYFSGLSLAYLSKGNLRIKEPQFTEELLREEHQTVGRLDARFKNINQNLLSETSSFDPQSSAISSPFTAMFMNYYYNELKVDKANNYHTNAYTAEGFNWDWKRAKTEDYPASPNTAIDLAQAMSRNPQLKILVINGYYDLATPFFGSEYTFDHLGIEKKLKQNISFKYYEAGHMMYIHPASAILFKKDIANFMAESLK